MQKRHPKQRRAGHPIASAIATQKLQKQFRGIRTRIYALQDGDDAVSLLTELAWLVGVGAEIAHATEPASPLTRRLHGALRQIVQMSAAGGLWQTAVAAPMYDAAMDAQALLFKHPCIGLDMAPGATRLSTLIEHRRASLADIAGAELYQPEKAGADE